MKANIDIGLLREQRDGLTRLQHLLDKDEPQVYEAAQCFTEHLEGLINLCDSLLDDLEGPTAPNPERDQQIIDLAKDQHHEEGKCEVDDMATVSEGDDNGAYVQAWVWVDFAGTALDKEAKNA